MELKNGERIDDLQFKDLKIIQNEKGFCFGIDAVLLSDFAKNMKKAETVVDFCTGTGIIAILLSGKVEEINKIYAVEVQKDVADMAKRSVALNNLEEKIEIINDDLKEINKYIDNGKVDAITVNPPYKPANSGIINDENNLTISRHEVLCTLEDIISKSAKLLKFNGKFYMVHRPERLVDIMYLMRKYKLEPKRIRFVHPTVNSIANLVLIEGTKGGKPFLKFEKSLYVYNENGNYTDEIFEIYNMKKGID